MTGKEVGMIDFTVSGEVWAVVYLPATYGLTNGQSKANEDELPAISPHCRGAALRSSVVRFAVCHHLGELSEIQLAVLEDVVCEGLPMDVVRSAAMCLGLLEGERIVPIALPSTDTKLGRELGIALRGGSWFNLPAVRKIGIFDLEPGKLHLDILPDPDKPGLFHHESVAVVL